MNKKDSKKTHKVLTAVLSVVALFAIVLVIGFSLLAAKTDGTENYTGAKLEAAKIVLDRGIDNFDNGIHSFPGGPKLHVESVAPTPRGENTGAWEGCSNDPDNPSYYTVTIRYVWLFNSTYSTNEYNVCHIVG